MYFKELYDEIKVWARIRRIAKQNSELLKENNFRVDWVGRIYTVINLPEEMLSRPDLQEGWVFMQLRDYDSLFMEMGVADYLFPEITHIADRGAYLLVLTGPKDYLGLWRFLWNLLKIGGLIFLGRIFYILIKNNWDSITGAISNLFNYIF
jgi:hypothetical protein